MNGCWTDAVDVSHRVTVPLLTLGISQRSLVQVLTVDAVAAAARAHGLALLPAVVNAVYKFLARRITALSQVWPPRRPSPYQTGSNS